MPQVPAQFLAALQQQLAAQSQTPTMASAGGHPPLVPQAAPVPLPVPAAGPAQSPSQVSQNNIGMPVGLRPIPPQPIPPQPIPQPNMPIPTPKPAAPDAAQPAAPFTQAAQAALSPYDKPPPQRRGLVNSIGDAMAGAASVDPKSPGFLAFAQGFSGAQGHRRKIRRQDETDAQKRTRLKQGEEDRAFRRRMKNAAEGRAIGDYDRGISKHDVDIRDVESKIKHREGAEDRSNRKARISYSNGIRRAILQGGTGRWDEEAQKTYDNQMESYDAEQEGRQPVYIPEGEGRENDPYILVTPEQYKKIPSRSHYVGKDKVKRVKP